MTFHDFIFILDFCVALAVLDQMALRLTEISAPSWALRLVICYHSQLTFHDLTMMWLGWLLCYKTSQWPPCFKAPTCSHPQIYYNIGFKCWGWELHMLTFPQGFVWHWCFVIAVPGSSSKSTSHERKSALTPTQRESVPAKSPVPAVDSVVSHSPFDPHHRSTTAGEVYRSHLPTHLDPAMPFHRALDPGKCSVYWQLIAKKYFMTVEAIIVQWTV